MFFKKSDLICVLNDEVELAKWKSVRRAIQAKETACGNLRGLVNCEIILKAWVNMSDWLEVILERKAGDRSRRF